MSGRHRTYASYQPEPAASNRRAIGTGVLVVVVAFVGVAGWVAMGSDGKAAAPQNGVTSDCPTGITTLSVAAAPDIAAVLEPLAQKNPVPCGQITVTPTDPAEMAAYLSGTATTTDIAARPDVWIPDTTLWLDVARASAKGQQSVPVSGTSIADSPTVIGMPQPVAAALPAGSAFSWQGLMALAGQQTSAAQPGGNGDGPQIAVVDPAHDGAGLSTLVVLKSLLDKAVNDPQAKVGITGFIKSLSNNKAATTTALLASLPQSEATGPTTGGIMAVPLSEQKIWQYDNATPAVPLVGLYPADGTPALDYPFTPVAGIAADHQKLADAFRDYLLSSGRGSILADGFRAPDGTPGSQITKQGGLDPAIPKGATPADHTTAVAALGLWSTFDKQLRMLAVIDISGSMNQAVPGMPGVTRLQMTAGACVKAMSLFGPRSSMGLWTFTTASKSAGGATIINKLVPIAALGTADASGTHGQAITAAYGALADQPGSRNGLYDTLLAAYQEVHKGWDPNKLNTVVVFTDGKDDNLNSMTSDALIAKLKAASNPAQPVRVFVVALGNDVNLDTLNKITAVTNGAAVHFADQAALTASILGSTSTQ
jgi:Ca-activated chloride channel homolog